MRHRLTAAIHSAAILSAAILSGTAFALPATAQVRLLETGIICPDAREGTLAPAPGTIAGHIRRLEGITFDIPGRTVPLVPGLSFGMRIAVKSDTDLAVRMVTRHPPMGPEGRTEQTHDLVLPANGTYVRAYAFEFDYEMLPGLWALSVEVDGQPVITVPFEVTATPDLRIDRICGSALQS